METTQTNNSSPVIHGSVLAELVSRTLFVGILILFVYGGFAYYVSKRTFDQEMGARLKTIAQLSADQMKAELLPYLSGKGSLYGSFQEFLRAKKSESQAKNLFILDRDGRVLVDANGQYEFRENDWLRDLDPEPFDLAKKGTPAVSILFPESDGGIYKVGYSPIVRNGKVLAVLGVEASAGFLDGLDRFAKVLFSFGMVCLFVMGGLLYAFARRFIKPIEKLAQASQKIAGGDFSQRVTVVADNELGALTHAFNNMAKRLQSHNEYILESMANGLLVVDLKGQITSFNRAASAILRLPQEKVLGRHYIEALKSQVVFLEAVRGAHEADRNLNNEEINLSEEEPRYIRLRSVPLLGPDAQELGTEIIFTDDTELRNLQARIKVSEKMATIGELAAGIAHEIRNPLGAMKGFTEILQRRLGPNAEAKEIVTDIASEIEILNKIVTNFLIFAKPTSLELQEVELVEVLNGVMPLIETDAHQKDIRFVVEQRRPVRLKLDVEQFRRALLNISLNAIQASPAKGTVNLMMDRMNRAELTAFLVEKGFGEIKPGDTGATWAVLLVSDHGAGILPEHLKRLFTPFFTTKTEGFGLGLSITQKIVEAMGGVIAAGNQPEGGAQFLIMLPALDNKKGEVQ